MDEKVLQCFKTSRPRCKLIKYWNGKKDNCQKIIFPIQIIIFFYTHIGNFGFIRKAISFRIIKVFLKYATFQGPVYINLSFPVKYNQYFSVVSKMTFFVSKK